MSPVPPPCPLVMITGTLCDARLFGPLAMILAAETPRRIVTIIDPIHGETVHALAQAVLDKTPERFALLGFSLGGIVALALAVRAPGRLAGLTLMASNARALPIDLHAARRDAVCRAREIGLGLFAERHLWPSYVAEANHDDAELKALVVDMAETLGCDMFGVQVEAAIGRPDSLSCLPRLRVPVLALCGESDGICPLEMHREISELAPGAVLAVVSGAGHLLPLEAPQAAARHVLEWLDRVDAAEHQKDPTTRPKQEPT